MFDIFNTREIAIGIWISLFGIWVLSLKNMPSMVAALIRIACSKPILIPFVVLTSYLLLVVLVLAKTGYWDVSLTKTTIIWFLTIACVTFFRIPHIADDEHYLVNTIKDNLKVIVAIQFVINFFTLPLWMEIITVPIITFFTVTIAFSETKPEYASATSLLSGFLIAVGLALLSYSGYKLITDFAAFAQFGTLKEFVLPFILSAALLPFTIIFASFTKYQIAFSYGMESIIEDKVLLKYAKRYALFRFNIRTKFLKRWIRDIRNRPPKNRSEVRETVNLVITLDKRERNPPEVDQLEGWSPYLARCFLQSAGIVPDDYHQSYIEGAWSASSLDTKVFQGPFPCNLSYYVNGIENAAQDLKLILNVNDTSSQKDALNHFKILAVLLFESALQLDLPSEVADSVLNGREFSITAVGKIISLTRDEWPSERGHSFTFSIQNPDLSN